MMPIDRQLASFEKNNCNKIFTEKIMGTKANYPKFNKLKEAIYKAERIIIKSPAYNKFIEQGA